MRRLIIGLFSLGLVCACSSSGDEPEPTPTPTSTPTPSENTAPSVPTLLTPTNELNCTDNPLDFSWNASSDSEGDGISYYIQLATNNSFSENLQVLSTSNTTANFTLLKGVAYYWRVNAKDTKNKTSSYSQTRKFYSEGEGVSNHIPYAASLVSPSLNAAVNGLTISLQWSGSDADNDPLTYDVYLGTTNPPALAIENITETTYEASLEAATNYYWKIVVKDAAGGEAVGQIWPFHTN